MEEERCASEGIEARKANLHIEMSEEKRDLLRRVLLGEDSKRSLVDEFNASQAERGLWALGFLQRLSIAIAHIVDEVHHVILQGNSVACGDGQHFVAEVVVPESDLVATVSWRGREFRP